ncbi:hypothetical protein C0995_014227 [Termitomyces sp. Mi166|nr:hypothetical protein C0995_014227 [Termitomyces sp. Mi166\
MVSDYTSVQREVKAYEALAVAAKTSESDGKHFVRQALDHFELSIDDRNYNFLIHEPLGAPLDFCLERFDTGFPIDYARDVARQMLSALEFIHSAQVIHADLQASNILLRIQDKTILKDAEEFEIKRPSSRKFTENTILFESRDVPGPLNRWIGRNSTPVLCDFGEARTGEKLYGEFIQPNVYRAPEIFLKLPWSMPVDIWNFGCMMWSFLFGHHLFSSSRRGAPDPQTADKNQVAWMAAFFGPPPPQLLADSGPRALKFFNENGSAKGEVPSETTLESVLKSSLERKEETMTEEDAAAFLTFIRRTLKWTQEERATAAELLEDPWIRKRSESGDPSQLVPRLEGQATIL